MEIGQFPNKLKMYRLCQGFSQKKVARLLGIANASMLSRWEHGTAVPRLMQVFCLARIYHVDPMELYDELWDQIRLRTGLFAQNTESFNINESIRHD